MRTYDSDLEETTNDTMTQTSQPLQVDDFERARVLILSYFMEDDADDTRLPSVLMTVRETCIDAFHTILVLLEAAGDPRFAGAADVLAILRDLEVTSDLKGDAERLLSLIAEQDAIARKQAEQEAAEELNLYRRAAIRLLTKFREPNIHQVQWELEHL